jgi:hypothetical protein
MNKFTSKLRLDCGIECRAATGGREVKEFPSSRAQFRNSAMLTGKGKLHYKNQSPV